MLALIVLIFVAIDVIILLAYDIYVYSGTQGTLEAIRMTNREKTQEEIGVRDVVNIMATFSNLILNLYLHTGAGNSVQNYTISSFVTPKVKISIWESYMAIKHFC